MTHFNDIDILCITETWLKPKHLNSSLDTPGFQPPIRKDRLISKGGGVAIYLRCGLAAKLLPTPPDLECVALHLSLPKRKKFVVLAVYRPPNGYLLRPPQCDLVQALWLTYIIISLVISMRNALTGTTGKRLTPLVKHYNSLRAVTRSTK